MLGASLYDWPCRRARPVTRGVAGLSFGENLLDEFPLDDFGFGDFFFDFELLSHQADIVIQLALGDEDVLMERSQDELVDLLHVIAFLR